MALYSIWVLEYAYASAFPKTGVLYGAHNQGSLKLAYCYTVIKGNGHLAMQDVIQQQGLCQGIRRQPRP